MYKIMSVYKAFIPGDSANLASELQILDRFMWLKLVILGKNNDVFNQIDKQLFDLPRLYR